MSESNNEINVEIKNQNYLLITIKVKNSNEEHKGIFTKSFFVEKENFFTNFDIESIKNFLSQKISKKEFILQKDEENILFKVKYINNNTENYLELIIPSEIKTMDENAYLNIITELTNIKKAKKEINERLNELEKKVLILFGEKENENDLKGFEKTIIKNKEEAQKILKWICPNNERKVKLLYRASLKENTRNDFHRLCDNKGPTITLIETTKGKRFGGYTSLDWDSSSEWKNDLEAFLFSLDNDKKYDVIPDASYKVYSNGGYGPWFGANGNIGLAYEKNYFIGNETHRENFSCKSFSTTTENEISGGKTFNIYKMEVYQILNE